MPSKAISLATLHHIRTSLTSYESSLRVGGREYQACGSQKSGDGKSHHRKSYATVASSNHPHNAEVWSWPKCAEKNIMPTPYQILHLKKGDKYTKRRFYELVKLYHPDRAVSGGGSEIVCTISRTQKLERFRLIVQANDILSDTSRRHAYDRCGAGWNGMPGAKSQMSDRESGSAWGSDGKGGGAYAWTGFSDNSDSAAHNATWEDWEQWYQRQDAKRAEYPFSAAQGPQIPNYLSNFAVVSLIVVFGALGAIGEITHAKNFSMGLLDQRDQVHTEANQKLAKTRLETREKSGSGRDERVQSFIYARKERIEELEDVASASAEGEEIYDRILTMPDRCVSGSTELKGTKAKERTSKAGKQEGDP